MQEISLQKYCTRTCPKQAADMNHKGEWAHTFDISVFLIPKGGKKYSKSTVAC